MSNKGLNKLGKFVKEDGEVVGEMFSAPNALTEGAGTLSAGLYVLSETLIRGVMPDSRGGGLGGEFGYGCDYENNVFQMHHFCWCEKEDCPWCVGRAPNFKHKSSGFEVRWYKWIGRSEEVNEELTGDEWLTIFNECWESIPADARERSRIEHDYENTPEYLAERDRQMGMMVKALSAVFDAMLPCFQCSNSEDFFLGGQSQWGAGTRIQKVSLRPDGSCSNCGHITTEAEHAELAIRQEKMDADMRARFTE